MGSISQQVLNKMINRKSLNPTDLMVTYSDGEEKSSDGSDDSDEPRMLSKLQEVSTRHSNGMYRICYVLQI